MFSTYLPEDNSMRWEVKYEPRDRYSIGLPPEIPDKLKDSGWEHIRYVIAIQIEPHSGAVTLLWQVRHTDTDDWQDW